MSELFSFQPGWATPVIVRHEPSFLAAFLRFDEERTFCKTRKQGKCPGLDHCHDCNWSHQGDGD